jgi:hypothetical protein
MNTLCNILILKWNEWRIIYDLIKDLTSKKRELEGCIIWWGFTQFTPSEKQQSIKKNRHICPYLLRNMKIERPNQVWQTDISYIPMFKGFMYLAAIIDVKSRKILFKNREFLRYIILIKVRNTLVMCTLIC